MKHVKHARTALDDCPPSQIRGVGSTAADSVVSQCGWWLSGCWGGVFVCAGVWATRTLQAYTRTHTRTTETLLILANGGGRGGWWLHIHVCEVNTFLTFQHFQKRRELWDQHSLLGFSTSLNCLVFLYLFTYKLELLTICSYICICDVA